MDSGHRRGGLVSISPSQTPRSTEKSARDLRSGGFESGNGVNLMNKMHDKDKGVNVQVIVRCRPLSDDETRVNTPVVITCNDGRREVTAIQTIANKQIDKTFIFDKVFGPTSQQKDLYDSAVSPIVFEVLEGYNCTIFAYGQTGTGKTYTMEGGSRKKIGDIPSDAGVIPRAVRQIFDILEAQNAEYSMKVTFLELYNEEITDLLANEESSKFSEDKGKKPIALMEDGKGGVFVRNLEEEIVTTANEIYKILERGSAKRRTAETLLNKQSSRSHSIFSITIHIKECTPEGEEMIRCGKLNLVDLAGSENISRSGARENRAREAGEINKSLLTLGRVINALVDHAGHVPYRDSKLTRLLRDSLGGKTKTCIIATISPSVHSLEESLNTLDYAYRAKNIKNKPEINHKMMKSDIMKDLYSEIVRLKQEVYAAREKNGIYIPRERYMQEEAEKKTMAEKIEKMELESETKDKNLAELQDLYTSQLDLTANLTTKLEKTENKLEETEHSLSDLEEKHRQANATIKDKEFFISNLLKSEKALMERAFELRSELENASSDVSGLFAKIERKNKIEDDNKKLVRNFESQLTNQLELLHKTVEISTRKHEKYLKDMEEDMHNFVAKKTQATDELRMKVSKFKSLYGCGFSSLNTIAKDLEENSRTTLGNLNAEIVKHSNALGKVFQEIASKADSLLCDLQSSLQTHQKKLGDYAQQQREAHSKVVETERSVSKTLVEFFETLEMHAAKVNHIVEEAQNGSDDKLSLLEKKFQECAVSEEKQLLEKVAELLASSNARKKKLVQVAVDDLRQSANSKSNSIQREMASMQQYSTCMKSDWNAHMKVAESNYLQHTGDVAEAKNNLESILDICLQNAKNGAQQWKDAEGSLLHLEETNVASANSIIAGGIEANAELGERFGSAVRGAIAEANGANEKVIEGVEEALRIDEEASEKLRAKIGPCCEGLVETKGRHMSEIHTIREKAGKCLVEDYGVDEGSGSTPRKRSFNLPNVASIEDMRTPSFDDLLKSSKLFLASLDASRPPLAAIN